MKTKKGSGKYAGELAKLKELNAIKEVLKKSDIENAALTNTSKDSETVSDNAVDTMLEELNIDKNSHRDLEIIESLTSQNARKELIKNIKNKQSKAAEVLSKKSSSPKKKVSKPKAKTVKKSKGKKKR